MCWPHHQSFWHKIPQPSQHRGRSQLLRIVGSSCQNCKVPHPALWQPKKSHAPNSCCHRSVSLPTLLVLCLQVAFYGTIRRLGLASVVKKTQFRQHKQRVGRKHKDSWHIWYHVAFEHVSERFLEAIRWGRAHMTGTSVHPFGRNLVTRASGMTWSDCGLLISFPPRSLLTLLEMIWCPCDGKLQKK